MTYEYMNMCSYVKVLLGLTRRHTLSVTNPLSNVFC
jgi:hypothetical protein